MFKRLFRNRISRIPKYDYWKKWELFELIDDLHKAENLLSKLKGGHSGKFNSKEDFYNAFAEELDEVESDNVADFTLMWRWFMPGFEWNDFTGSEGKILGNQIFSRLDRWKRNHAFVPGTKVSLNGDFGVVIDSGTDKPDNYGLIRWDTDKESDIEDWRGLFGTFIDQGGQIISQTHEFNYIDDDGTQKK